MNNQVKTILLSLGLLIHIPMFSAALAPDDCLFIKNETDCHTIPFSSREKVTGRTFGELFHESSSKQLPLLLGALQCSTTDSSTLQFIDICSLLKKDNDRYSPEDFKDCQTALSTVSKHLPSFVSTLNILKPGSTLTVSLGHVFIGPDKRQLSTFSSRDLSIPEHLSLYLTFALANQSSALKEIAFEHSRLLISRLQRLNIIRKLAADTPEAISVISPHILDQRFFTDTMYWLELAKSHSNDPEVITLLDLLNEHIKLDHKQ